MEVTPSFLLFVAAAAFTPGPNNIMIMASGLNYGVKASLPHLLGIAVGVPTMFLAVGFGLTLLFKQYLWLHAAIQLVGMAYLLYLAWLIATAAPDSLESSSATRAGAKKPISFVQAALFQWINPKTWLMGTGAIAAFSDVGGDVSAQITVMAFVFFLMAFPSAGAWMVFGSWLARWFSDPARSVLFNRLMAILLVASIVPIISELADHLRLGLPGLSLRI